ncbi:MAG: T9SS type A sorting domain-containing protein [Bacteroidota bacterium]
MFDILGREVAALISQELKAGSYETTFDASAVPVGRQGLASGVYLYRLQSGNFSVTKKLVVLR